MYSVHGTVAPRRPISQSVTEETDIRTDGRTHPHRFAWEKVKINKNNIQTLHRWIDSPMNEQTIGH